jgi:hypothetical protein
VVEITCAFREEVESADTTPGSIMAMRTSPKTRLIVLDLANSFMSSCVVDHGLYNGKPLGVYGSNHQVGNITLEVAWRTLKISTDTGRNLIRKPLVQGRAVNLIANTSCQVTPHIPKYR